MADIADDGSLQESEEEETWVDSFCSMTGHEYFAQVTVEFIEDDFNLTGLQSQVPLYKEALEIILDVDISDPDEDELENDPYIQNELQRVIEEDEEEQDTQSEWISRGQMTGHAGDEYKRMGQLDRAARRVRKQRDDERNYLQGQAEASAELLYGLIHQRFITSRQGIQVMASKYESHHFGFCPRVFCNQAKVLPVGCCDIPGQETVKLFCPSCLDIYTPPNSRFHHVDGAFFGTTFGCLFFMTFPECQIAPTDDPLGLAATHPTYAVNGTEEAADQQLSSKHASKDNNFESSQAQLMKTSRSSSLTTPAHVPATTSGGGANDGGEGHDSMAATSTLGSPSDHLSYSAAYRLSVASRLPVPPQPDYLNGMITANVAPGLGDGRIHEPRIYGFRVSERAKTGPRMKWLRMRPRDMNELDERARHMEKYGDPDAGGGDDEEGEEDDEDEDEDLINEQFEFADGQRGGGEEDEDEEEEEEQDEDVVEEQVDAESAGGQTARGHANGAATSRRDGEQTPDRQHDSQDHSRADATTTATLPDSAAQHPPTPSTASAPSNVRETQSPVPITVPRRASLTQQPQQQQHDRQPSLRTPLAPSAAYDPTPAGMQNVPRHEEITGY